MNSLFDAFVRLAAFSLCLTFFLASCLPAQDDPQAANKIKRPQDKKIASYADLVQAYESQKIKFDKNEKAQSLAFRTTKGEFKGVMIVKWDGVNGVVHLIQTWPLVVPKEKTDLFLKAAQTLNHGFLFPGIGINLSNGGTYYRLSVPIAPRGYLRDYEIGTYTRFALNKAAEFMPTLSKVLEGKVSIDELTLYHQKYIRELAAKRAPSIKLTGKFTREIDGVEWLLDFSEPQTVKVYRDGKLGVVSAITIEGNNCTFQDKDGPLASSVAGKYSVVISGNKLTLRAVEDEAKERNSVLSGGVWSVKN